MSNDPNCPFGMSRSPEAAAAADAELLRMFRRVVGEWHARAVGLGHDGVAAMLDVAEATTGNGACSKCGVHQSEACPMPDPDECIQRSEHAAESDPAAKMESVATLRVTQWPTGREWAVDADEDMLRRLTAGCYRLHVIAVPR